MVAGALLGALVFLVLAMGPLLADTLSRSNRWSPPLPVCVRRVEWLLAGVPIAWLVVFVARIARAPLALGFWPYGTTFTHEPFGIQYSPLEPTAFPAHHAVVWFGWVPALLSPVLIAVVALIWRGVARGPRWRPYAFFGVSYVAFLGLTLGN